METQSHPFCLALDPDYGVPTLSAVQVGGRSIARDSYTVMVAGRTFREIEREIYAYAIRSTRSLRGAAALLGIPRATFRDRVRRMFR